MKVKMIPMSSIKQKKDKNKNYYYDISIMESLTKKHKNLKKSIVMFPDCKFFGIHDNDFRRAYGTFESEDMKFVGYCKDGKFFDKGYFECKDKCSCDGIWRDNVLIDGEITLTNYYKDKFMLEIIDRAVGDIIKIKYNCGNSYIGEHRNFIPKGHGVMSYEMDQVYSGEFLSGLRNGFGTLIDLNEKKVIYEGYWKDDDPYIENIVLCEECDEYLDEPISGLAKCPACREIDYVNIDFCIYTGTQCNVCMEDKPKVIFNECKHALTCRDCVIKIINNSMK
tara:strand:- start:855 stop:1694 length:840 start_codon:yes stop_codon:yes gene_type:complete